MLELIFLSPLLAVLAGAFIVQHAVRRRPFTARAWLILTVLAAGAFLLPLSFGVWIPDFLGTTRTLATATASDGHSFRVVQAWNYCDFYTTLLYITDLDGRETLHYLDIDDNKTWSVPLALDESNRMATITLGGERPKVIRW